MISRVRNGHSPILSGNFRFVANSASRPKKRIYSELMIPTTTVSSGSKLAKNPRHSLDVTCPGWGGRYSGSVCQRMCVCVLVGSLSPWCLCKRAVTTRSVWRDNAVSSSHARRGKWRVVLFADQSSAANRSKYKGKLHGNANKHAPRTTLAGIVIVAATAT